MIFPARIRQARELAGLTQQQLAVAVGAAQSTIASIERGSHTPSEEVLNCIASQTGVQPSFFSRSPVREISLGSLAYRARSAVKASERDQSLQYARLHIEQFQLMTEKLNLPLLRLPRTVDDPELAARTARLTFGLGVDTPVPHLLSLVENHGFIALALPIVFDKIDAFSSWATIDIERPFIALSSGAPGDRLRLSVAHEIGHLCLHRGTERRSVDVEREANQFAAEFLLPAIAMRQAMNSNFNLADAAHLKPRWGVSMQALIRRAKDLNIITERRYHYLFQQLAQQGWRKHEPANLAVAVEKPRVLRKMVEVLFGSADLAASLASSLDVTVLTAQRILALYDAPRPSYERPETYPTQLGLNFNMN